MMAKTHLAIGMAAALVLTANSAPTEIGIVLAGSALGSIYPDVDCIKTDTTHDAITGEGTAFGITIAAIILDYFFHWGLCENMKSDLTRFIIGIVGAAALWIIGYDIKKHRGFTHSILAMILLSFNLYLIYPSLGTSCLVGFITHILLDLMNKKGIRILWPFKWNPCFKWCYADRRANKVFMSIGTMAMILILGFRIAMAMHII